jgi:hypothetical protein
MCFLASTCASPIDTNKEEVAEILSTVTPVVVRDDAEVSAVLASHEQNSEGEVVTETVGERDDVKIEETAAATERKARNFGAGNQVNEIGGANHQLISDPEDILLQKLNNKCSRSDVSSCVMLKLVSYMNRLLKKSNIEVFEGLHITQTASEVQVAESARHLENPRSTGEEDEDEDTQLSQLMADKLWTFVRTRSLRWSVLPDADLVMSTSPDKDGALNLGMSIRTGKGVEKGEYKHFS